MPIVGPINAEYQVKDGSLVAAKIPNSSIPLTKLVEGADLLKRTGLVAMTGDFDFGGFKGKNMAAGVLATDAVNVGQLSALLQGLKGKDAVRVATTVPVTTATVEDDFAPTALNGWEGWIDWYGVDTTLKIDGISIVANTDETLADRIAIISQTGLNKKNHGIFYAVEHDGTGRRTKVKRATDADSDADVKAGLYFWVTEGSVNGDKGFYLVTDNPITLGSTALDFTIFNSAGQINDGPGLYKSGNVIGVGFTTLGCIQVNADSVEVTVHADNTIERTSTGLRLPRAGAEAMVLVANSSGIYQSVSISGDITLYSSGSVQIGTKKVVNSNIADNAVSLDKMAKSALGTLIIGQGTANSAYYTVTGDITMDSLGVTTIGAQKVKGTMIDDAQIDYNHLKTDSVRTDAILTRNVTLTKFQPLTAGYVIVGQGAGNDVQAVAVSNDIALAQNGAATVQMATFWANHMVTMVPPNEADLTGLTSITPPSVPVPDSIMVHLNLTFLTKDNYSWNAGTGKIDMVNYTFQASDVVRLCYAKA